MKVNIIILILFVIVVIIGVIFFVYKMIDNNTKNNNCLPFSGGSFHVNFVVNGGEELPNMLVGIACSPDSYDELPIPVREGYTFDGWYYDKELKEKIEFTNTRFFTPVPEYDKNKCRIGYQDIEIYAKWHKE